jgi:hypothetical protein
MMRVSRPLSVIACVALASTALLAQDNRQRGPGGGGPTRLIVRALHDGQPVADLKPADVTIRVDGKQHAVTELELVTASSAAAAPGAAAPAAPASALPPPFATNAAEAGASSGPMGGREFVIMLDEDGIAPGQEDPVRKAVAKLMSEAGEGDRFGLISLRVGGKQIPPTTNRAPINEEINKLVGGGLTTENIVDFTCRTKRSMGALLSAMQMSPAGRTLIVVTSGLAANPVGIQPIRSQTNPRTGDIDNTIPETCQIRSTDLEDFGTTAALSPANMYIVHFPQGMPAPGNMQAGQTGTENLAGVSNAEFIRLTGGQEASLSRIIRETSSYYIATLDEATGPMRRIDARVSRDGVKVIARPAAASRGRGAATASAKGMAPRDMIKNASTTFTEVPLRAAGYVSREGASGMKLVTLFEPVEPGTKLTGAAVAIIDEKGNAKQWNARSEDLARSPVLAPMPITPGKYRVRVAATTAAGGGTVDFPIEAVLPEAGPLKMSAMLTGIAGDKGFAPTLQFTPADKFALGVLEVYGVPKGANLTAQFEIAPGPSDAAIGADAGRINNGPTEDSKMIFGGFGIETLQPGDYVLRIKVSLDGKEVGTATRTIRKVTGS